MTLRQVFINDFGRLRSGWRLLLFVVSFIAASLLVTSVVRAFYALVLATAPPISHAEFVAQVIFRIGLLTAALGSGYLCARLLEGLPWKSLGLTFHAGWLRDLIIGSLIGFAAL